MPDRVDEHTVVFLMRPAESPAFTADELDRLQAEHLGYLRTRRAAACCSPTARWLSPATIQ